MMIKCNFQVLCAAFAIIALGIVAVSSQSDPGCPATYPGCSCDELWRSRIVCQELGVIEKVPPFNISNDLFVELSISTNTRLMQIQANAFQGFHLNRLTLQRLGIKTIDEKAFLGLATDALEEIQLDQNLIRTILPRTFAGFTGMKTLHLENNNLQNLPADVFSDLSSLSYLYLYNNRLNSVPDSLFQSLPSLILLSLFSNELTVIKSSLFAKNILLESLDLSDNSISTIERDAFQSLTSLNRLAIVNNRLQVLDPGVFQTLSQLGGLDLSKNNQSYINSDILLGLRSLTTLTITRNQIRDLPVDLLRLQTTLRVLDLSQNGIIKIPDGFFANQSTLDTLTLDMNFISDVPVSTFQGLSSLKTLNIRSNELRAIRSDTFFNLPNLTNLDLSNNLIEMVEPGSFALQSKLYRVNLRGNRMMIVPSGIFDNLPSLNTIDLQQNLVQSVAAKAFNNLPTLNQVLLSNNQIRSLPIDTFWNVPKLRTIYLSENDLNEFPQGLIQQLTSLVSLPLDGNNISYVPERAYDFFKTSMVVLTNNRISFLDPFAFHGEMYVTSIKLNRNQLTDIPADAFNEWKLDKVTTLDVSYNLLTRIRADMFQGLSGLQQLDLSYNNITVLEDDSFKVLIGLKTLNLAGNKLSSLTSQMFTSIAYNPLTLILDSNFLMGDSLNALGTMHGLVSLSLESNSISQLPDLTTNAFGNLTTLQLRSNNLTQLNSNTLGRLTTVTELDLGSNLLTSDSLTSLQVLGQLNILRIDRNMIQNIPSGTRLNSALTELDMSFNQLSNNALDPISTLSNLQTLILDGNQIGSFPFNSPDLKYVSLDNLSISQNFLIGSDLNWLNAFPAITELYLDDNAIDYLPNNIFLDKFNLQKLSLRNNRLSSLNSLSLEWFEMSGQSLFLSGNKLTDIASDAFLSLSYLKQLDLSNNSISRLVLPPVMSSLQVLRIDSNQLDQFPEGLRNFGTIDVLTLLNVSNNLLTSMPSMTIYGTSDNVKVQTVDLHGNQLTSVDDLTLVGYFRTVNLQGNSLTDISNGTLGRILNLTQLDLSWNLLSTVPQAVCSSSFAITNLKLSDNRIATLCKGEVLANMSTAILDLDLSYNQLVNVPPSFLSFLGPSLNHLNLSNNLLTGLNGSSVETSFPNLQSLYMEGNSWNCDCNLLWYRQMATRIDVDWPVCATPPIYRDTLVECYDVGSCVYPITTTPNPKCSASRPAFLTHPSRSSKSMLTMISNSMTSDQGSSAIPSSTTPTSLSPSSATIDSERTKVTDNLVEASSSVADITSSQPSSDSHDVPSHTSVDSLTASTPGSTTSSSSCQPNSYGNGVNPEELFTLYGTSLQLFLYGIAENLLSGWNEANMTAVCILRPNGTASSGIEGLVTFSQQGLKGKVTIKGSITGLTPGYHGFHVHEFGNLTNGCASTGSHFNPMNKKHGGPNDSERHVGDLGNVFADSDGTAAILSTDGVISLNGPNSIIGRACVVHQDPDDLGRGGQADSQTTGHSGARIACGTIGIGSSN
jgi:Leucine-rich repeat (LRR) protein/Cu/Zn superoxide dismutase